MPTTITPVGQYTTTAVTRPSPGEKVAMETGTAPLAPTLQAAFDRSYLAWQMTHAMMPWRGDIEVTATDIIVPPLAVMLLSGGTWKHWPTIGATLPLPSVTDAWRYCYLYDNAGVLDVEFSTTAPDDARVWKTGTFGTHRYLCPVRFGGSGALPYRMTGRRALYSDPAALYTITTVEAARDLSSRIPPYARAAILHGKVTNTSGGATLLSALIRDPASVSDSGIGWLALLPSAPALASFAGTCEVPTNSSQEVNAGGTVDTPMLLTVLGWVE